MTVDDAVVVAEPIFIPRNRIPFFLVLKCCVVEKIQEKVFAVFGYASGYVDKISTPQDTFFIFVFRRVFL